MPCTGIKSLKFMLEIDAQKSTRICCSITRHHYFGSRSFPRCIVLFLGFACSNILKGERLADSSGGALFSKRLPRKTVMHEDICN